jgi:glycyl-tRNA synthetase alpha chain
MSDLAAPTFQDTIRALESYWADYGCVLMQPYHTELAAGTMNPATFAASARVRGRRHTSSR